MALGILNAKNWFHHWATKIGHLLSTKQSEARRPPCGTFAVYNQVLKTWAISSARGLILSVYRYAACRLHVCNDWGRIATFMYRQGIRKRENGFTVHRILETIDRTTIVKMQRRRGAYRYVGSAESVLPSLRYINKTPLFVLTLKSVCYF